MAPGLVEIMRLCCNTGVHLTLWMIKRSIMETDSEHLEVMDERYWKAMLLILKGEKMLACTLENPVKNLFQQLATNINTVSKIVNIYAELLKFKFLPIDSEEFLRFLEMKDEHWFSYAELTFIAFQANDANFTAVLLSQGFMQMLPDDYSKETRFAIYDIISVWRVLLFGIRFNPMRRKQEQTIKDDQIFLKTVVDYLCDMSKSYRRGFRRIILFSKVLRTVTWYEPDFDEDAAAAKEYAECLKLYFRALPDPFFTVGEFYELITLFFVPHLTERYINYLTEVYVRFCPESEVPFAPRSLKHLCRCAVRKSLADNKSKPLPQLVEKLDVSRKLKGFLTNDAE